MLKNKFKIILVIVISGIITSGLSVYATYNYFAKDISYTKSDGTEINVEQALNDLYDKSKNYILPSGTYNATTKENQIDISNYKYLNTSALFTSEDLISHSEFTILDSDRTEFNILENTKLAYLIVCRGTSNIPYTITVSGNIITNQELISNTSRTDVNLACYISVYKLTLSGNSGTISLTKSGGSAASQAWNACLMY